MTFISKIVGVPAIVIICAWLIMSMFAQTTSNPPPCLEFTSDQENTISEYGPRFLPGGDLHGYPIMAERVVRFAFLQAHGYAGDPFNLHFKAAYLHQTVNELKNGYCWKASSGTVLGILEALKGVW